jgi:hypothetical protein
MDAELCNDCATAVNVMGRLSMLRACALVVVGLTALWSPQRVQACKCAPPLAVSDALHAAAAVFEGRVTKLTPLGTTDLVVELSVVRTWKDADTEHILLRTRQDGAACGFEFVPNESYLVYADEGPTEANLPGLQVLRCGRSKLVTEAEAELAELGMGVVPVSARGGDLPPGVEPNGPQKPTPDDGVTSSQRSKPAAGGCASCSSLGRAPSDAIGLVWALAVSAVWSVLRRRRATRVGAPCHP